MIAGLVERARAVPIERMIEEHGVKLRGKVERVGPCPRCGGHDRFAINTRKQVWNCRGCQQGGDAIALVRFLDGSTFHEACATLAGDQGREAQHVGGEQHAREDAQRTEQATCIWNEGVDPRGTPAEGYLAARRLPLPPELRVLVLRFHPACPWESGRAPCLIAAFRAIAGDTLTGVHRVRLDQPERWPKAERRMLGSIAGSAVKLDPASDRLAIGEGVETCMAARLLGLWPVWALGAAGGIENLAPVEGVEHLVILGENDSGRNRKAAEACRDNWQPRRVTLLLPRGHKDFNDYILFGGN
jgi:Toprim domain/CHC2 zinc finger